MNIRTRKVLRDIWQNKVRTALVVISIAVGLMAISTTFRAQAIFRQNLDAELTAINQASATLLTTPVNDDVITAVSEVAQIDQAEGIQMIPARVKIGEDWRTLRLLAIPDFADVQIDKIRPEAGAWPPQERTLFVERSSLGTFGKEIGDTVMIESPTGTIREIPIAGTVHDLNIVSGRMIDQVLFGYTTLETAVWLGLPERMTEIKLTTADDRLDVAHIRDVADAARDRVEANGNTVFGLRIPNPGKHLLDNVVQSLLLILGSLGILSLFLSAFLVFNTISALLIRQVPQIGIMKAIGAPRKDILLMYLTTILIFSAIAVVLAVPLGMIGARVMTAQLGYLLNFDVTNYRTPPTVLLLEIGIGLLVPLLAAMVPIWNGTRITVRQAMDARGGGGQFGSNGLDTLLTKLRGLPATLSYAARNIFRRKLRLFLTLFTLSLGGAIFITVLSVRASLFLTIEQIADYWQQDVTLDLQRPYRLQQLQDEVRRMPNVAASEGWLIHPTFYIRPDGQEAETNVTMFAVPPDSQFLTPTLINGRWLTPDDTNALVANIDLTTNEPAIALGETVRMRVNGQEADWEVVGIVTPQLVGTGEPRPENPIVYVPYAYFAAENGLLGRVNRLNIQGTRSEPPAQTQLSRQVRDHLHDRGFHIQFTDTNAHTRAIAENLTMPVLLLLLSMALLFALVGGLSLLGTMSLNVLERTQEIGIIRSIGGTSRTIMQIVVVEGVFVGLISWLLAALLAYPLGWVMSTAVGISFIKVPLIYDFAPIGILLWLGIVTVIAVLASYLPARNASRLVVREALAYE